MTFSEPGPKSPAVSLPRPHGVKSSPPATCSAPNRRRLTCRKATLVHHLRSVEARSKTLKGTRLILVRHAETAAPDRFHGAESDIGLSAWGARQAEMLGQSLKARSAAAVYSSGMRRAIDTAAAVGRACACEPIDIAELHERRIGPLSGQSREEGWSVYAESKARWIAGDLEYTHPGGESFADIRRRVVPIVETLAARHPGDTIIVIAHGVVIRVILTSLVAGFQPADYDKIAIDFASVNVLVFDGESWQAETLNQVVAPSAARPVA